MFHRFNFPPSKQPKAARPFRVWSIGLQRSAQPWSCSERYGGFLLGLRAPLIYGIIWDIYIYGIYIYIYMGYKYIYIYIYIWDIYIYIYGIYIYIYMGLYGFIYGLYGFIYIYIWDPCKWVIPPLIYGIIWLYMDFEPLILNNEGVLRVSQNGWLYYSGNPRKIDDIWGILGVSPF